MSRPILKGSTNESSTIRIVDSTDGTPEMGVVAATGGLALYYRRQGAAVVALTALNDLAALTTAHTDGGLLHIGNGFYRVDPQDAAFATGSNDVLIAGTASGMVVIPALHPLFDFNPYHALWGAAETKGAVPLSGVTESGVPSAAGTGTVTLQSGHTFATNVLFGATMLIKGATQGYWQEGQILSNTSADPCVVTMSDNFPVTPTGALSNVIFGTPAASAANPATVNVTHWGGVAIATAIVRANIIQFLGTTITETVGQIAAAFSKFFNKAAPTGTVNSLADAVPGAAGGGLVAGPNAGTTAFGALTVTGAMSINGTANVAQPGDSFTRIGVAGAGLTDLGGMSTTMKAQVEQEVDDSIGGGTGTALTAIPWAGAWDAEVQSEVQDAIEANFLQYLIAVAYNPASKPGAATALLNVLVEDDGGVPRLTTNALEQGPTGAGASSATIAAAVLDKLLADHAAAGSLGAAITAIQAKAAQLQFTTANLVDSNAERFNNRLIEGTGASGDKIRVVP